MNFHQIKQRLHGFFFDDDNSRIRNASRLWSEQELRLAISDNFSFSRWLVSPIFSNVWGTDISHWDGNVDLQTTKNKGASFVFIKGIDGTLTTPNYAANRQRAIDAQLPDGPYQWLYRNVNISCVAQAQAADAQNQKYPTVMPRVLDHEWTYYGGKQSNPDWNDVRLWCKEYLRLGNPKPIYYSAKGYADLFGQMPSDVKDMFSGFWFANYGVTTPALPLGFSTYDFWQFTSSGDASVYSPNDVNKKEVDINYYNGTREQFAARFGGVTELPPTGEAMSIYNIKNNSTTSTRTIRQGPGVVFASVDNLPVNGTATGDFCYTYTSTNTTLQASAGDKWIQIGANRWLAWIHKGVTYLTVDIAPAPVNSFRTTFTIDHNGKKYAAENIELLPIA